jgi:hypothetical protein
MTNNAESRWNNMDNFVCHTVNILFILLFYMYMIEADINYYRYVEVAMANCKKQSSHSHGGSEENH